MIYASLGVHCAAYRANNLTYLIMRTHPKQQFKKAVGKPTRFKKFEVLKWLMFILSLLGIFAWISGAAYLMGYWGVIGLDGPIVAATLQQTALIGFVGAITTWLYAPTALLGVGIIIVLLGIQFRQQPKDKKSDTNSWRFRIRKWLALRFDYNSEIGLFGVCAVVIGYLFIFLVEVPLIGWSIAAHDEGKKSFFKQTCKIRSGTTVKAEVFQINGKTMSGRIIDRSERVVVLSDGFKVHVLTIDKVPALNYSIDIPPLACTE